MHDMHGDMFWSLVYVQLYDTKLQCATAVRAGLLVHSALQDPVCEKADLPVGLLSTHAPRVHCEPKYFATSPGLYVEESSPKLCVCVSV